MENLQHIWNTIISTNLFNFVIFLAIFAWIGKKFNMKGMLEAAQHKVSVIIETAKKEREAAENDLKYAEKAVENLESELNGLVEDAKKSADIIGDRILVEAKKQIEGIESNAEKIISAEERVLVSKLTKSTSKASIEVAKSHIKSVLEQTPTLHEKYIDESINELDRLSF